MQIVWDERKRLANIVKHGMDFATVDESFFERALIVPARSGREIALGRLEDGSVAVLFLRLGTEGLSIISMRTASPRERRILNEH